MGHSVGDRVLIEIARRLAASLRFEDVASRPVLQNGTAAGPADDNVSARLGGDEFTVLLGGITHPGDALRIAHRVQQQLSVPIVLDGEQILTSVSIGIALSTTARVNADDLLRDADIAMYRAKSMGKGRCEIFDAEMQKSAMTRLKLEADLRKALEREEFKLHYQPIVSLRTGQIFGLEALVRWEHCDGRLRLPDEFISVAETIGLIGPLGSWVLQESCRNLKSWQTRYSSNFPLTITVNVSAKQFHETDLVSEVYSVLRKTGISPDSLHLEITESVSLGHDGNVARILASLKAVGVRISIDDFGMGYSSLSRLHRFPADVLKIDRSFIARIAGDNEAREIVRHIVTLAHSLHLHIIAEGIETEEQLNFLTDLGCEFGQGYLFSKPVDNQSVEHMLKGEPGYLAATLCGFCNPPGACLCLFGVQLESRRKY
ncbi:MAG: bifunctional diguanylate cyclase/phosphodiesterase, partial [Acidobacteriota bacterium]|nr:bifunctional diguanylate cyclase/phosphodiesterase [Acidobacteriota bacterium]